MIRKIKIIISLVFINIFVCFRYICNSNKNKYQNIPFKYKTQWTQGLNKNNEEAILYHYKKHKEKTNSGNIVEYLDKASDCKKEILKDLKKKNSIYLKDKYIIKENIGKTKAHKYINKYTNEFIILSDMAHKIVSYGRTSPKEN